MRGGLEAFVRLDGEGERARPACGSATTLGPTARADSLGGLPGLVSNCTIYETSKPLGAVSRETLTVISTMAMSTAGLMAR